jgi:hypothetical protein
VRILTVEPGQPWLGPAPDPSARPRKRAMPALEHGSSWWRASSRPARVRRVARISTRVWKWMFRAEATDEALDHGQCAGLTILDRPPGSLALTLPPLLPLAPPARANAGDRVVALDDPEAREEKVQIGGGRGRVT